MNPQRIGVNTPKA